MANNRNARWIVLVIPLLVLACTLSLLRSPIPGPNQAVPTLTMSPTGITQAATVERVAATGTVSETGLPPAPPTSAGFCEDPRPRLLIDSFKKAINSKDGGLLSSLVSPEHGMDARLLRDGRVVNYDREHAAALFESTYVVDWGNAAGSGLPIKGAFRDLFVPDLKDFFPKPYTEECNQIQTGGTTYSVQWPYPGVDYYSLYYAGSAGYASLDWHTWVVGMDAVGEHVYLYAIMQFEWEP